MVFGIDLGTTNSLIGSGDILFSGLVPSCVNLDDGHVRTDRSVFGDNIIASYKKNMMTSRNAEGKYYKDDKKDNLGAQAIKCSSIVLRDLANIVEEDTGIVVKDVVISHPAYFTVPQREAVKEAAREAGLNPIATIPEPTAAALYLCKDVKDKILVYDLGGGTFDVSAIDSQLNDGIYTVLATKGEDIGGDDLDYRILEDITSKSHAFIGSRVDNWDGILLERIKDAKITIQRTRSAVTIDTSPLGIEGATYTLTPELYKEFVHEVFKPTLQLVNLVLSNDKLRGVSLQLIFVGGSTHCPYLREMVVDALRDENIRITSVLADDEPDKVVARGVAYFASLIEEYPERAFIEDVIKRICITDGFGGTITVIEDDWIIPCTSVIHVKNDRDSDELRLSFYQSSSMVTPSDDEYIGEIIYNYGEVMPAGEGQVEITVEVSADGTMDAAVAMPLYDEEPVRGVFKLR